MSEEQAPKNGSVSWRDLTVPDARSVADFYHAVVGWEIEPVSMGDYDDYCAAVPGSDGEVVAGICHARGANAKLPPQWLVYITVDDVEKGAAACIEAGGKVIDGPREAGGGRMCIIEDPAGAMVGLYSA